MTVTVTQLQAKKKKKKSNKVAKINQESRSKLCFGADNANMKASSVRIECVNQNNSE
jgi:hypothetical protein